ncbi:MAG TPA: undecaprenyl-diphosphate phosphatase [Burkholderiaceae bacterium]
MTLLHILVLAVIQGIAELLPVSSSAHVIAAEKLMGLDPTAPEMTVLLVLLHTGTMFAVIVYFWKAWREAYFSSARAFREIVILLAVATALTAVVGLGLQELIKHVFAADASKFEIEQLFGNTKLMAAALVAAGVLIIASSRLRERNGMLTPRRAALIGAVQGLCLPFRGFSRSGATISTGLAAGISRKRAEEFSFALAVVLTPPVIAKEVWRLHGAKSAVAPLAGHEMMSLLAPGLLGMVFSFLAGLLALRWLSRWLEADRWHLFGGYCILAAVGVWFLGR